MKNKTLKRLVLIIAAIVMLTFIKAPFAKADVDSASNIEITVCSGDTLWDIADRYCDNTDVRNFITDIKILNNMTSSEIYAGEKILIPVK